MITEKRRAYLKEYRAKNREYFINYMKEYHALFKDLKTPRTRQSIENRKAYAKKYRIENREKINSYKREWNKKKNENKKTRP